MTAQQEDDERHERIVSIDECCQSVLQGFLTIIIQTQNTNTLDLKAKYTIYYISLALAKQQDISSNNDNSNNNGDPPIDRSIRRSKIPSMF
jgi:hypothetical protein